MRKRPFLWAFGNCFASDTAKRSQPAAAPAEIGVGAAEGCDLLILL
jgi:hypothetical protein